MSVLKRYNGTSWEPIGPAVVNDGGGGSTEGCVRFDEEQDLSIDERSRARRNIKAAASEDAEIQGSITLQIPSETAIIMSCDTSGESPNVQDMLYFEGENSNNIILRGVSDPEDSRDAANKGYVDGLVPASAAIDSAGLITFKNAAGTSLFTLQLPIYGGDIQRWQQ